jgi:hypothetical protein
LGKARIHITMITIIAGFITLAALIIYYPVPSPPAIEMKFARESLSLARENEAEIYSAEDYNHAKKYYDSAMITWRRENERFIYSRNYDDVAEFAQLAKRAAQLAAENSSRVKSNLKEKLAQQISTINDLIIKINRQFHSYPLTAEIRNNISKGKMLLKDAETALKGGKYLEAGKRVTESEYLLKTSYDFADSDMRNYFRSYPVWKSWIDSTITVSRQNCDYSIIVDKFSRKFFMLLDGEIINEYTAELGRNWVGDKRKRGDRTTPEGMYKIVKKIEGDSTGFYKALLLNYPNNEDTVRFAEEISRGSLAISAKLGGHIEIHGSGGRGADWTEGCIALKNREMDIVFRYAKLGTPVTIVGSMRNLRNIQNR